MRNRGMLIVAGRLLAVDRAITPVEMAGARVIDLRDDQYVLPGIFDVHAHYNMTLGVGGVRSDEYTYNPLIFLANGVTSTFPAGEYDPEGMMAARQRIDAGEQVGPRIYNSGPYFGTARRGWNQNATDADIYRDVDEWAAKGARAFKAKGIAPQHLRALIERAHLHGLTVTAHLESGCAQHHQRARRDSHGDRSRRTHPRRRSARPELAGVSVLVAASTPRRSNSRTSSRCSFHGR